jgi:hypothetical protein
MLATCAELFIKGHRVDDIYFVPISLTYEKLLEEFLYSNELLGIPKPRETVGGLVKARSILNQSFGSIFVNFTKPISLRELIYHVEGPNLRNRLGNTLTPRFVFKLDQQQLKSIESISYVLLLEMLRNQIIQPISLICTCILSSIKKDNNYDRKQMFEMERSINLENLCLQVEKLKRVLDNLGARVYWPLHKITIQNTSNDANDEMIRLKYLILDNIEAHSNLFNLFLSNEQPVNDENLVRFGYYLNMARKEPIKNSKINIYIKNYYDKNNNLSKISTETSIFDTASVYLAVCSYKNQLVHFLIRIGFVVNCLLSSSSSNTDHLVDLNEDRTFEIYRFLSTLFNREFIFKSDDLIKDFKDSILYLINTNLIKQTNTINKFELIKFNLNQFIFFASLFQSIIQNYYEIYLVLLNVAEDEDVYEFDNEKLFTKQIQQTIFNKMIQKSNLDASTTNSLFDYETLSLNMITNSLLTLRQFHVLMKAEKEILDVKTNTKKTSIFYQLKLAKLKKINERLEFIIKTNRFKLIHLNMISKSFDLLASVKSTSSSLNNKLNENVIQSTKFELSDYDESLLSISNSSPIWNDVDYYDDLFQIKNGNGHNGTRQQSSTSSKL